MTQTPTLKDNQPLEHVQHIRIVLDEVLARYGVTDFGRTFLAGEERLDSAVEPENHQTIALAG